MPVVGIIAREDAERRDLMLAVEELGFRALPAPDLKRGLDIVRRMRPGLLLVAQTPGERTAESLLGELAHEAPLTPVVVAMSGRKASRAVELMKAGAFDVVATPWTPENLSAVMGKALRFRGTAITADAPGPEERMLLRWGAGLAAVVLMAAVFSWFSTARRQAKLAALDVPPTYWELPYSHPAGLAIRGEEVWISDWYAQTLHRHDLESKRLLRSAHLPRETPGALAFAADALWVSAAPRSLVKHLLDEKLTVADRVRDVRPQTIGAVYDGLYLWTCDAKRGRLYKRLLDERLSVVQTWDYPGQRPVALAFDGRSLWSLDAGNKELLEHDINDPAFVRRRLPLSGYQSGEWKPTGLAWASGRLWSVAQRRPKGDGPGRLFMHELP
jgi:CheY-like chemotaxis protein